MDRIFYCITLEHDWRWTLVACLVCVVGVGTAIHLLSGAGARSGPRRRNRIMLGGSVGGLAAFATHFLAMQGYQAGGEVRYGVWLTVVSLLVVMAGTGAACLIVASRPGRLSRGAGAIVAVSAVAAMHFIGMAALQLAGGVVWDPVIVTVSIVTGLALAGLTGALVYGPGLRRLVASTLGGALAIVCLHFVGASAMSIDPRTVSVIGPTVSGVVMTGVLTAMITGIGGLAGLLIWMEWLTRSSALARIREAVEAMPDGIAVYDANDRLVLWNTGYSQVNPELSCNLQAGMSFRDIVQIGLDDRLYADAVGREAEWAEERMTARAQPFNAIEQRIAGDRWIRVSDRRTAAGGIVTVCTDITDLKNDARALAEARDAAQAANSAKSQFLANMSHEIRTPLNGVIGLAQAMARSELNTQQREMLELIQSSGQTLQVLLSDILDLARVESGRLELANEAFDLSRAVQ
ncbi:MAG TPA: MHYT domain-containing protein, partial [Brevundimonas sp.]|nr:MHYT domain-containing protein [Brevundimonas sp.]